MRNEGVSALLNLILPLGQPGSCCKSVLQEWSGMKESESGETPWLQEKALTCTLRGDHFGFAASTISLHGVGGHGDGIGSLGLEPSNDHFLFARCQREIVSVLRPTPKGSSLLPAGVSALFQHAGTPNPRARDTLGLLWEMAEGRAPFPWRGTHSSANTARLCRALCKASSSRSASHTFPVFTQTTSASKCFRSLQSFPLHCAASEEAQRFQGDYIFFIITPLFSPQRYF